ncbi:hypothetical protein I7I48_10158 [Histoplasma ohiense]|nr:hypothetical protein I7I48_10158 [Histoplasma ohiense (nom. inval.)]
MTVSGKEEEKFPIQSVMYRESAPAMELKIFSSPSPAPPHSQQPQPALTHTVAQGIKMLMVMVFGIPLAGGFSGTGSGI